MMLRMRVEFEEEVEDLRAVEIEKEEEEKGRSIKVKKGEVENIDKRGVGKEVEENKTGVKSNKVDSILFAIALCILGSPNSLKTEIMNFI